MAAQSVKRRSLSKLKDFLHYSLEVMLLPHWCPTSCTKNMRMYFFCTDRKKGFKILSVSVSWTTMAGWIITCARDYLQPVYNYFHRQLLERHFLMADETPIRVLKEPDRRPQSKSYVWLMRSGEDRLTSSFCITTQRQGWRKCSCFFRWDR